MDQAVSITIITATISTPATRRQLRDAVRMMARERGCTWLRPILDAAGVEMIRYIPTPVLLYIVAAEGGRAT